jgi:hypothetical protein
VPSFAADQWLVDSFASPTGVLSQSKVEGCVCGACQTGTQNALR